MSPTELAVTILIKKYIVAILSVMFGAGAHALEEIQRVGWKGWIAFFSDMGICIFFGWMFFHIAQFINPNYTPIFCSVGSYWGTGSFKYARRWVINSLKANIPDLNED